MLARPLVVAAGSESVTQTTTAARITTNESNDACQNTVPGMEVQSEKNRKQEINEALRIVKRAMERGVYDTVVSALEKFTQLQNRFTALPTARHGLRSGRAEQGSHPGVQEPVDLPHGTGQEQRQTPLIQHRIFRFHEERRLASILQTANRSAAPS